MNRRCPLTDQEPARVVGYMPAGLVCAANNTYRPEALEILGVSADDAFPIVEGPSGFTYAGWLPDDAFLARVYEEAVDHARTVTASIWYRRFLLELSAGLLAEWERRGGRDRPLKLLDFGCGYGVMMRLLASPNLVTIGYEPSAARRSWAGGADLVLGTLDDVRAAGPFDLIVCTEVLEHLARPHEALTFMRENARPDALLAITVPQCETYYVSQALEGFSRGEPQSPVFNPWEHLNYFSRGHLASALSTQGFRIVSDFGSRFGPRDALARLDATSPLNALLGSARIAKRVLTANPSTQLFCACI